MKEYAMKRLSSLLALSGVVALAVDAASGSFSPEGSSSDCGHACHTIVKAKDYIFTAYGKR
jgi:hypothetical protein